MTMGATKILIVDDDEAIVELVRDILEDEGYCVTTASNGADALAKLRSDPERPSLILLDMRMPLVDGRDFRAEQTRDPELGAIPVVVLSADTKVAVEAPWVQASGYLRKPVRLQELLDVVDEHCGRRRS
jgi:CheY-like chemotaxis protein